MPFSVHILINGESTKFLINFKIISIGAKALVVPVYYRIFSISNIAIYFVKHLGSGHFIDFLTSGY